MLGRKIAQYKNAETDDIAWLTLTEYQQETHGISELGTFSERVQVLESVCTDVESIYKCWITDENGSIFGRSGDFLLTIERTQDYQANALPQTFEIDGHAPSKQYVVFKIYEDAAKPKLLQFRVSDDGWLGEIVWIQKGERFNGSEIMKIFQWLNQQLKTHITFIKDDAHINDIPVRVLRPLTTEDQKTWYETQGFKLVRCKQIPDVQPGYIYDQSPIRLKHAISTVKQYKLKYIVPKLLETAKAKFLRIIDVVFKVKKPEAETLGELVTSLTNLQRDNTKEVKQRNKASKNLLWLYRQCLTKKDLSKRSKFTKHYQTAVNTLHETMLYADKSCEQKMTTTLTL